MPLITVNYNPLLDYVLIKEISASERATVVIDSLATKLPGKGVVIAVGPGAYDQKVTIERGDIVLFQENTGTSIVLDEGEFLTMRESQILGAIKPTDVQEEN